MFEEQIIQKQQENCAPMIPQEIYHPIFDYTQNQKLNSDTDIMLEEIQHISTRVFKANDAKILKDVFWRIFSKDEKDLYTKYNQAQSISNVRGKPIHRNNILISEALEYGDIILSALDTTKDIENPNKRIIKIAGIFVPLMINMLDISMFKSYKKRRREKAQYMYNMIHKAQIIFLSFASGVFFLGIVMSPNSIIAINPTIYNLALLSFFIIFMSLGLYTDHLSDIIDRRI